MSDRFPPGAKRTWEQASEQSEVNETTEAPEVHDPSADKKLPQVSEMADAQAAHSQEVTPDESQEAGDTEVSEVTETVEAETTTKFVQPESDGSSDEGQDDSEDSDES